MAVRELELARTLRRPTNLSFNSRSVLHAYTYTRAEAHADSPAISNPEFQLAFDVLNDAARELRVARTLRRGRILSFSSGSYLRTPSGRRSHLRGGQSSAGDATRARRNRYREPSARLPSCARPPAERSESCDAHVCHPAELGAHVLPGAGVAPDALGGAGPEGAALGASEPAGASAARARGGASLGAVSGRTGRAVWRLGGGAARLARASGEGGRGGGRETPGDPETSEHQADPCRARGEAHAPARGRPLARRAGTTASRGGAPSR